jgi:hypothetical protein
MCQQPQSGLRPGRYPLPMESSSLRLLAMTWRGHAFPFSRRNSPELCIVRYPRRNEGAGKTGWPLHPGPPRKENLRERDDHRYRRRHSGLPCAVVYGLYALSSVNQRLPPLPHAHLAQSLAPAWARQDHTTSPSASMPHVSSIFASTAFRATFVTTRTPLVSARSGES